MSGKCGPEDPVVDAENNEQASRRRLPSVLGLSVVSVLNVICLVFIGYHFTSHPKAPFAEEQVSMSAPSLVTPITARTLDDTAGNIDFAPTSRLILSIASGIEMESEVQISRESVASIAPKAADLVSDTNGENTPMKTEAGYWIQLGALSEQTTAKHYWSRLKERHATLLGDQEPSYFGPLEVGGSLHHIRLGPMKAEAAEDLCDRLKSEGADCFCIRPKQKG